VVEDDYDSEYRYESMPIASMQGLDSGARVIYIGTFSKTLFPSLRIGYIVIPRALVGRFLAVRKVNDLCPSHLYQAALADFIKEGHFARHIRRTRQLYAERRNALVGALGEELGPEIEILGAEAGMHLVVTLPPGLSDKETSARAAHQGLWLWPLSSAYAGPNFRHGFVLGFGGTKAEDMRTQVRHLKNAMRGKSGYRKQTQSGH
jgi:GntR family transcriptional regulator/MocR family aminotransferase